MTWILIAYVGMFKGGAATSTEFNSLKACQSAASLLKREVERKPYNKIDALICVPKGEVKP